jgi:hypothetical protein
VLGAKDPLADGQQHRELVASADRIARQRRQGSEGVLGGESLRVLRAEDPLNNGQQRGELVAGPGRVPRLPGPTGPLIAGD